MEEHLRSKLAFIYHEGLGELDKLADRIDTLNQDTASTTQELSGLIQAQANALNQTLISFAGIIKNSLENTKSEVTRHGVQEKQKTEAELKLILKQTTEMAEKMLQETFTAHHRTNITAYSVVQEQILQTGEEVVTGFQKEGVEFQKQISSAGTQLVKTVEEATLKSRVPRWKRNALYGCGILGLMVLAVLSSHLIEMKFSPWLFPDDARSLAYGRALDRVWYDLDRGTQLKLKAALEAVR